MKPKKIRRIFGASKTAGFRMLKPYPEYKDSGVKWIGDVPESWKVEKLKFNSKLNQKSLGENTDPDYEFNYLDISNVSKNGEILNTELIRFEEAPSRARKIPINKDIIISTVRTYLKAIAYLKDIPDNFIVSTGFCVLNPNKNIYNKFLYYLVSCELFVQTIVAYSKGIAYPAINSSDLANIPILFPDLNEQKSIVSFLDKKTSEIDLTIEKDTRLIELLKEKRTALINHAVTKGLDPTAEMNDSGVEWIGEIPEEWEVVPLTKFLESKSDYRGKTPEKVEEGVFLVTGKNIKKGKIDYELSKEYVPEDQYDIIMRRGKPKIGDLLFTTEAPLGEVANVDFPRIALAQRIIKMRGKEGILDNYYLKYYMMSETFQGHLQRLATGSTALGIKASKLFILRLILPPYTTQLKIVNNVEESISKIDEIIRKIQKNIILLEEYKKSLIHHVVTGKVNVIKED